MSQTPGQAALGLDELLRLHPEQVAAAVEREPRWLADQLAAAARDLRDRAPSAAARYGCQSRDIAYGDHPAWVRLTLLEQLITWLTGHSRTCLHSPSPQRPEPIAAAAWKPGLMVCGQCPHLLRIPPGSPADRTCDACGTVTGTDKSGMIWPTVLTYGPLAYSYGVCADCRYWTDAS